MSQMLLGKLAGDCESNHRTPPPPPDRLSVEVGSCPERLPHICQLSFESTANSPGSPLAILRRWRSSYIASAPRIIISRLPCQACPHGLSISQFHPYPVLPLQQWKLLKRPAAKCLGPLIRNQLKLWIGPPRRLQGRLLLVKKPHPRGYPPCHLPSNSTMAPR